jgi:hypothetical protein
MPPFRLVLDGIIGWPLVSLVGLLCLAFLTAVILALRTKEEVKAALSLRPFGFSLEARRSRKTGGN